ncbi:MAG TPA: hypothetical protein PLA27_13945 [Anaerolineales bacterium]|jgi:hypothetical protein|nr:hypothetical protein [Anaerolineales bacterium]HQX17521.1 hypothetical protein [Anaerolineales bacterium]
MMPNKEKLKERFLRDPLPRRLGGLAATLGRISSVARKSSDPENVARLLEEARYLIEWTAADAEPEVAAELVSMQTMLSLWLKAWDKASQSKEQSVLLSVQAKQWSDRALDFSGLISQ